VIATTAGAAPTVRRTETRSAVIVIVLALVGIVATLGLRAMTQGSSTAVTQGGVSAAVPAGWRTQPGVGELAFIASDPRHPGRQYVARIVDPFGASLAAVAEQQSKAKGALLNGYVGLDTKDVTVGSATGVRVQYAYLTGGNGVEPRLIRGMDLFIPSGDAVLLLTYESPDNSYADGLDQFYGFVGSAKVEAAS
jgi:hypothetical protein